jgi:hypothetical protein
MAHFLLKRCHPPLMDELVDERERSPRAGRPGSSRHQMGVEAALASQERHLEHSAAGLMYVKETYYLRTIHAKSI